MSDSDQNDGQGRRGGLSEYACAVLRAERASGERFLVIDGLRWVSVAWLKRQVAAASFLSVEGYGSCERG